MTKTVSTKSFAFIGVSKREQIVLRSFFNLAKNELVWTVAEAKEIDLSASNSSAVLAELDFLVVDFDSDEWTAFDGTVKIPVIGIGSVDRSLKHVFELGYPVQWTDFREAVKTLEFEDAKKPLREESVLELVNEIDGSSFASFQEEDSFRPAESGLPKDLQLRLEDDEMMDKDLARVQIDGEGLNERLGDYEYQLEEISVGSHSFTNSDYVQVVDDVRGYEKTRTNGHVDPVVLMTDDESASMNSVLIVETDSIEAWDLTESAEDDEEFFRESAKKAVSNANKPKSLETILARSPDEEVQNAVSDQVSAVVKGEEYWREDAEIMADQHSIMFIKAERRTVYSAIEPSRWPMAMRGKVITKSPLSPDWRPKSSMSSYPIDRLMWVNDFTTLTGKLIDSLNLNDAYALLKWPPFDLLEMDNRLLKLSTKMLIKGGTVADLATKVGCEPSIVCGFINACYRAGYIINRSDLNPDRLTDVSGEGVLGMIKDAFR